MGVVQRSQDQDLLRCTAIMSVSTMDDIQPQALLAADLARALGVRITAEPGIATRPFSGAITLDGRGSRQLLRLTPALDATIRRTPDGWTMSAGGRATP